MREKNKNAGDAKGSFKLDAIETVCGDPMMTSDDLAVIVAHLCFLDWPSRRTWISTSRARAATGLSERQISYCRARLVKRGYLVEVGRRGNTKLFRVENPLREVIREHVVLNTEHFREKQTERQADRRRKARVVSATRADTDHADEPANESAVSASHAETGDDKETHFGGVYPQAVQGQKEPCIRMPCGDVSAQYAGNSPELNPSIYSSRKRAVPIRTSTGPPYLKPEPQKAGAIVAMTGSVIMTADVVKAPPRRPPKNPAENAYSRLSQGW